MHSQVTRTSRGAGGVENRSYTPARMEEGRTLEEEGRNRHQKKRHFHPRWDPSWGQLFQTALELLGHPGMVHVDGP